MGRTPCLKRNFTPILHGTKQDAMCEAMEIQVHLYIIYGHDSAKGKCL